MSRVLIEFTQDTTNAAGDVVRTKGDKLYVDPMSAKSFVDKKKVAKLVVESGDTPAPAASAGKSAPAADPAPASGAS